MDGSEHRQQSEPLCRGIDGQCLLQRSIGPASWWWLSILKRTDKAYCNNVIYSSVYLRSGLVGLCRVNDWHTVVSIHAHRPR